MKANTRYNGTNQITKHVTEIRPQLVCFWFICVWKLQDVHEDSSIDVEVLHQQQQDGQESSGGSSSTKLGCNAP